MGEIGTGEGTSYPAGLDTDALLESTSTLARKDVPNDLAKAIVAVETELGLNPAGIYDDVVSRLNAIDTNYLGTLKPADIITKGPWVDVRAYDSFSDAIDAIGASNKTLLITEDTPIPSDKTVPANVELAFTRTGKLSIANGVTLTINGAIQAGLHQIFSYTGTGTIAGSLNIGEVYPQWWIDDGDGTSSDPWTSPSDTAGIQEALDALPSEGGKIKLIGGMYQLDEYATVPTEVGYRKDIMIEGDGWETELYINTQAKGGIWAVGDYPTREIYTLIIKNLKVKYKDSNAGTGTGIHVDGCVKFITDNCQVLNFGGVGGRGVYLDYSYYSIIKNSLLQNNESHIRLDKVTNYRIKDNDLREASKYGIHDAYGSTGARIKNNSFESCSIYGIYIQDTSHVCDSIKIDSNYFEDCATDVSIRSGNTPPTVYAPVISNNRMCGTRGIDLDADGALIIGNYLPQTKGYGIRFFSGNIGTKLIGNTSLGGNEITFYNNAKTGVEYESDWARWDTATPTSGTYSAGYRAWESNPAAGATPGWICTTSGTMGTLAATTGDTVNGEAILTGLSQLVGLTMGAYLDVAGAYAGGGDYIIKTIVAVASTTVDASSASGQKVLNVTATTNFAEGETIIIDRGTNDEILVIDSIQSGVSLTLTENLANTYTNEVVENCVVMNGNASAAVDDAAVTYYAATWEEMPYLGVSATQWGALGALVEWTDWTPTLTDGADLSGFTVARYYRIGNICFFRFTAESKNVTTAGTITITLPFTAAAAGHDALTSLVNDGAAYVGQVHCGIAENTNYFTVSKNAAAGAWAGTETGVRIRVSGFFEIA